MFYFQTYVHKTRVNRLIFSGEINPVMNRVDKKISVNAVSAEKYPMQLVGKELFTGVGLKK